MVEYLLQTTAVMAILYLPYHLWYSKHTFFTHNRIYILASLIISLLMPVLWSQMAIPDAPQFMVFLEPARAWTSISGDFSANTVGFDVMAVLTGLYIVVAVMLAVRTFREIAWILRIFRQGNREEFQGQKVIISSEIETPFSFMGIIFIPEKLAGAAGNRDKILRHEYAHVVEKHNIDILFIELLCIVMWVNPFVHLYRKALIQVHEYQADHFASHESMTEYARLLLLTAQPGLRISITHQFITPLIKKRILMMTKDRSPRNVLFSYLFVVPVIACVLVLGAFQNVNDAHADNSAQQLNTGQIDRNDQAVLKEVDEMPRFPGCEDQAEADRYQCSLGKLMEYVATNLKYPESAYKNKTEGKVMVKFVVEASGTVSKVKIVKSLAPACDAEVIRIIESMNSMSEKWIPGRDKGNAVAVEMVLPVQFAL